MLSKPLAVRCVMCEWPKSPDSICGLMAARSSNFGRVSLCRSKMKCEACTEDAPAYSPRLHCAYAMLFNPAHCTLASKSQSLVLVDEILIQT